jgi:hypothetical protein
LKEATAREVVYSVGVKPIIKFPVERDLAVRFVGKCARHGDESSILVRDPNEAAYLCKTLGGTDRLQNFEHAEGVHYIQYKDGKVRAQWYHIRAFVLAYTNIGIRRMLRRFPQKDVLRVCTDAIYACLWRRTLSTANGGTGYEWRPEAAGWKIEHSGELQVQPNEAQPLPSDYFKAQI